MRAARNAGATPLIELRHTRINREIMRGTNDRHAVLARDIEMFRMKKVQAYIAIRGSANASEASDVPASLLALYSAYCSPRRSPFLPGQKLGVAIGEKIEELQVEPNRIVVYAGRCTEGRENICREFRSDSRPMRSLIPPSSRSSEIPLTHRIVRIQLSAGNPYLATSASTSIA